MHETTLAHVHVERSLPEPWRREATFNDVLYEWMRRAPWLLISLVAHVVLLLVLAAFPWDVFRAMEAKPLTAAIEASPENVFEDPPEELPVEIEEQDPTEDPLVQDADVSESEEDFSDELAARDASSDFLDDSFFEVGEFDELIGIGGGGIYGERFGPGRGGPKKGGAGVERAIHDSLEWLDEHQSDDGSWDCDGFMAECGKIGNTVCDGAGHATGDVAMTGLALLAFLGNGNTTRQGPYRETVTRGILWLRLQQDPDTGVIGPRIGHGWVYGHAMATLAVCEAYYFSKNPILRQTAQNAINSITRARNPYGVWRYDSPPIGDNDTSVTGWMLMCLKSAQEGGLQVDPAAFDAVRTWLDEVTDPVTGRVGYHERGSFAPRVTRVNDHFSPEKGESMTAVGLLSRVFLGQDPEHDPVMLQHADLISRNPPKWDPEGFGTDVYYWYYGSYAMFQMGGKYWKSWNAAMKEAVLDSQRKDGDEKGSWDPLDAWGYAGGRVYETALMTLCLEVYFRYSRVLGAR